MRIVKLETINRGLAWLGLRLVVTYWSGRGRWIPTTFELITARQYWRRVHNGNVRRNLSDI